MGTYLLQTQVRTLVRSNAPVLWKKESGNSKWEKVLHYNAKKMRAVRYNNFAGCCVQPVKNVLHCCLFCLYFHMMFMSIRGFIFGQTHSGIWLLNSSDMEVTWRRNWQEEDVA